VTGLVKLFAHQYLIESLMRRLSGVGSDCCDPCGGRDHNTLHKLARCVANSKLRIACRDRGIDSWHLEDLSFTGCSTVDTPSTAVGCCLWSRQLLPYLTNFVFGRRRQDLGLP
jgi:hypothetical protein